MIETRQDAVYIRDLTGVNDTVATAVNITAGVDSSYSATYFPWIQVKDIGSSKIIFVPPSNKKSEWLWGWLIAIVWLLFVIASWLLSLLIK
jgi:hypothetical protein